jgi:uncharacterized protein involved in exopolysaccharide biosynthesis
VRYLLAALICATVVWSVVAAVMLFAPKRYTVETSLILPNSDPDARVQLNEVGQAYATSRSTYDSKSLDPRVNYREIILSDNVLADATRLLAEKKPVKVPAPRVKLIDQSSVMELSHTASSAKQALKNAQAVERAFQNRLEALRQDELRQREAAIESSILHTRRKLTAAQHALVSFKVEAGVVSQRQLDEIAQTAVVLRKRAIELEQVRAHSAGTVGSLAAQLRVPVRQAGWILTLQGDAVFMEHMRQFTTASAEGADQAFKWDSAHPKARETAARRGSTQAAMLARARQILDVPISVAELQRLAMVLQDRGRDQLLRELVQAKSQGDAASAELVEIGKQTEIMARELPRLANESAKLEDLQRQVDFAEAVHTGAAGKPDVNHSNTFASYPMVQVLVPPALPTQPSSPRLVYLVAGGAAASIFIWVGLSLAWLRHKR